MATTDVPSSTATSLEDVKQENFNTSNTEKEDKVEMESTVANTTLPQTEEELKAAQQAEEDLEYPHGLKLAVILAALCLAVFLVALDQTIISTAIPKITDHFRSIQDIGWYGSSYLLTSTAMQPTFGRIYTIFGVSYHRTD